MYLYHLICTTLSTGHVINQPSKLIPVKNNLPKIEERGVRVTRVIFNLDRFNGLIYAGDPMEAFLVQVRVAHHGVEEREGMAVGRGDAKLALRLKPACGKARPQGHHSETIKKPYSAALVMRESR